MEDKIPAMLCLKCGKILAILGEPEPGMFGIDKDTSKRFYTDENGNIYIVCKFCEAKNALIKDHTKPGPLQLRLSHLIE
jgi:hypothetical protein